MIKKIAALLAVSVALAVGFAVPASAGATITPPAACVQVSTATYKQQTLGGHTYAITPEATTTSACGLIFVRYYSANNHAGTDVLVRVFPATGSSYICCQVTIPANYPTWDAVANGFFGAPTNYRLEFTNLSSATALVDK